MQLASSLWCCLNVVLVVYAVLARVLTEQDTRMVYSAESVEESCSSTPTPTPTTTPRTPSQADMEAQRVKGTHPDDASWLHFLSTAELHPKMDYLQLGEYHFPPEQLLKELEYLIPQALDMDTMAVDVDVSPDHTVEWARAEFSKLNLAWSEVHQLSKDWADPLVQREWCGKVAAIVRLQELEMEERRRDTRPPLNTLMWGSSRNWGNITAYDTTWFHTDAAKKDVFDHSFYSDLNRSFWVPDNTYREVLAYPYLTMFSTWQADLAWHEDTGEGPDYEQAVLQYDVLFHLDFVQDKDEGYAGPLPRVLLDGHSTHAPLVLHLPAEPHNLHRCSRRPSPLPPNCPVVVDLYGCMKANALPDPEDDVDVLTRMGVDVDAETVTPPLLQSTTTWYHYPAKHIHQQFYVPFYTQSVFVMSRQEYWKLSVSIAQMFGSMGFEVKGLHFPAFASHTAYMHGIAKCKYLVVPPIGRPSLGQLIAEGVMLGVPTFSPVQRLFSRMLSHPFMSYEKSEGNLRRRVDFLENNAGAYEQVRAFQARRVRLIDTQYMPSVRQVVARVQSTIHNTTRNPLNPIGDRYDLCRIRDDRSSVT